MLAYHIKESDCVSASVGGHIDHVHLLIGLSRTITIAKLVERIKTETSRWAKDAVGGSSMFAWQSGYGAFSVSHSMTSAVDEYIRCQAEHHAALSFQDEFRRICSKHGIEIDERYVWDRPFPSPVHRILHSKSDLSQQIAPENRKSIHKFLSDLCS